MKKENDKKELENTKETKTEVAAKEKKPKKEEKTIPASKLPKLFTKTYTEKQLEKYLYKKIYIKQDKEYLASLIKECGKNKKDIALYSIPKDLMFTKKELAQLKTLAHSLIAYAAAAQNVFAGYETRKVSCESEEVKAQIAAATATAHHSADNSGMITFSSVSFVCTKDARLRFYLNTAGATGTPEAPRASSGKATLKYITRDGAKQYFVEIGSIDAADFGKQIEVSYGGSVIRCSVLDYCGIVLKDGSSASAALKQLAKALVVYHTNAKAYFN